MPKVSVIIPVYNTEKYLRKCLDSVCNQTLSDIEIICVNDCSTDNSFEILKEYASKDDRIKLIDFKENKGAAVARNTGIDEAKGEYIGFVDSDDFIDLDFYEKLYKEAINKNADIVKGAYKYPNGSIVETFFNEKIKEDKNNFSYGYCGAIYNTILIKSNNITFPILKDMEDPIFAFKSALKANKVIVLENTYINITVRENSQTAGIPSFDKIRDKFIGLHKIIEFANNSAISEKSYVYTVVLWLNMIIEHSFLNKDINIRKFLAESIINTFEKIKYKDEFIVQLGMKNEFLAQAIVNNKKEQLINYGSALILYNLRKKIKHGK